MEKKQESMVSIWTWSSLILAIYGVLLLGVGIYRVVADAPSTKELAEIHPDIWWPVVMLVVAGGLWLAGRAEQRGSAEE